MLFPQNGDRIVTIDSVIKLTYVGFRAHVKIASLSFTLRICRNAEFTRDKTPQFVVSDRRRKLVFPREFDDEHICATFSTVLTVMARREVPRR